jgi:hypothetical protein
LSHTSTRRLLFIEKNQREGSWTSKSSPSLTKPTLGQIEPVGKGHDRAWMGGTATAGGGRGPGKSGLRTVPDHPQGRTTRAHVAGLASQCPQTQEGKPWYLSTVGDGAGYKAPVEAAEQPLPPCEPAYGGGAAPEGPLIRDQPLPFPLTILYPVAASTPVVCLPWERDVGRRGSRCWMVGNRPWNSGAAVP